MFVNRDEFGKNYSPRPIAAIKQNVYSIKKETSPFLPLPVFATRSAADADARFLSQKASQDLFITLVGKKIKKLRSLLDIRYRPGLSSSTVSGSPRYEVIDHLTQTPRAVPSEKTPES